MPPTSFGLKGVPGWVWDVVGDEEFAGVDVRHRAGPGRGRFDAQAMHVDGWRVSVCDAAASPYVKSGTFVERATFSSPFPTTRQPAVFVFWLTVSSTVYRPAVTRVNYLKRRWPNETVVPVQSCVK